jgi:hypothetical protein
MPTSFCTINTFINSLITACATEVAKSLKSLNCSLVASKKFLKAFVN